MSALDNAVTLKEEADSDWWDSNDFKYQKFTCAGCGYQGTAGELLVDPDPDNTTIRCPVCRTAAWVWD